MTIKKYILILTSLSLALNANAQKKKYTMAEATNGIVTNLAPKAVKQPTWEPGTDNFYEVVKAGDDQAMIRRSVDKQRVDTFLKLSDLNKELKSGPLKAFPN